MDEKKLEDFTKELTEYNKRPEIKIPVSHINTTFEDLANAIEDVIDNRDYEMKDILEDYRQYCYNDGLITNSDSWKYLRMQLAGTTIKFNKASKLYYSDAERGFRPHDYLGLYSQKSLRLIGKICARITAVDEGDGLIYETEFGELTDERKKMIDVAIEDGLSYGYDLRNYKHRYFFVDKFYETDFRKISKGGCMGTRIFDLTEILKTDQIPEVEKIADLLKKESWS